MPNASLLGWSAVPTCVLWERQLPDGFEKTTCGQLRLTSFQWRFGIPNCAADGVAVSSRGGSAGVDVVLSAPPRTAADAAAAKLAIECGVWDHYWGIPGFPFDPGLPFRLPTQTGTVPKFVSWPGNDRRPAPAAGGLLGPLSRLLSSAAPRSRRAVRHSGVALLMYRHTWVGHFGHNLLHNLACVIETFHERGLTHLLHERAATFVALDLAPTGGRELPAHLLGGLFKRVVSASELPASEEHVFEHALLGQSHRHMLHMSVYATPSLAHRRLYTTMSGVLERFFCRHERATCRAAPKEARAQQQCSQPGTRDAVVGARGASPPRRRLADRLDAASTPGFHPAGSAAGGGREMEGADSADAALPAVHSLVVVRCSMEDVKQRRCPTEDPTGHAGRRALLNEPAVVSAMTHITPGSCASTANPGNLPLAQQVPAWP